MYRQTSGSGSAALMKLPIYVEKRAYRGGKALGENWPTGELALIPENRAIKDYEAAGGIVTLCARWCWLTTLASVNAI